MMKNNDELLEQMIKDEFEKAAKEEVTLLEDDNIHVPAGMKEALYLKISSKIEEFDKIEVETAEEEKEEKQPDNLYANMSEEDRKALEIGRRVMEEEARAEREGKVVRKKKRIRMYFGVAAAFVFAMALGVTSMGGPEKVINMMKRAVGSREITQVDSSDDNLVIVDEDEEEAYEKISEEFGVVPVKVMLVSENMKFVNMKLDEIMQIAELYYEYDGRKLIFFISASYKSEAFGYGVADEVIDKYFMEVQGREIEIKKYQVAGKDEVRLSADFKEMGLKYLLTGIVEQSEFELIVNRLHFL
ncbi:hypothetical protein AALD74_18625 [Lachnospiraceae bacterium 48-21]